MDKELLEMLLRNIFRSEELVRVAHEVIDDVLNGRTTRRRYMKERNWRKEYVYKKLKKAGLITWRFNGKRNVAEPTPLLKAIMTYSHEPQE